jgi:HD-like signal output (HDOD) protein
MSSPSWFSCLSSVDKIISMGTLPRFEDLLPTPGDPAKAAIRDQLIHVLNSQGEILPSANSPRGKLWHLVNSPESSVQDCEEVILLDSSLASRIFRVANSGAYGMQSDNISDAILRLGLKFVREQVFNAGVFKQYSGWVLPPEWDLFWLRNIFVARSCERMASIYGPTNGSEYLAGLIHDMGWLFLATYLPNEFTQLFASGVPINQAEKEILPFGHADISAAIAARSLLPAQAVSAIQHHHDGLMISNGETLAQNSEPDFLGIILNIGDKIADSCGMNMFGQPTLSIEEIQESPEVLWLNNFGEMPDIRALAEEEVLKAREIFEVYFSNRKFN